MPALAGHGGEFIRVNAAGTGMEAVASPFTGAGILSALAPVDGTGSGLDADYLRGVGLNGAGAWFGGIPRISGDGVMEVGKFIDFHETSDDGSDYSVRLTSQGGVLYANGQQVMVGTGGVGFNADTLDGADSTSYMAWRGTVDIGAVDGAIANGFYNVQQVGYSEGMLTFTPGGSLGTFQLRADHGGALSWRNRTDSSTWQPWRKVWNEGNDGAGSGLDADLLDGMQPFVGDAGNTIAMRDVNGYLHARYLNQSSANNENPTVGQLLMTNGSDNFLRKGSLAHLVSQMGFVSSLGTNGYVRLPGGLIVQWGRTGAIATDTAATVTFPTAFPSTCAAVFTTANSTTIDAGGAYHVSAAGNVTTTNFVLTNDSQTNSFFWLAIGY